MATWRITVLCPFLRKGRDRLDRSGTRRGKIATRFGSLLMASESVLRLAISARRATPEIHGRGDISTGGRKSESFLISVINLGSKNSLNLYAIHLWHQSYTICQLCVCQNMLNTKEEEENWVDSGKSILSAVQFLSCRRCEESEDHGVTFIVTLLCLSSGN